MGVEPEGGIAGQVEIFIRALPILAAQEVLADNVAVLVYTLGKLFYHGLTNFAVQIFTVRR